MAHENNFEESWEHVREHPFDHQAWMALVVLVEDLGDAEQIREAIRGFLTNFPLCIDYWKRLSSHEKNFGGAMVQVLEEAVAAMPHSYQMWLHFCTEPLAMGDAQKTRAVFRRSLDAVPLACGTFTSILRRTSRPTSLRFTSSRHI
jgi:hypothetical protein